jgi:Family of unknown function (DUF6200)
MAQQPQTQSSSEQRDRQEGKQQYVVVELSGVRPPGQVRRLREGRGRLMRDIDDVIEELNESGTVKTGSQPVVIVVREASPPFPWPFDPPEAPDLGDDDDD